ncbi:MAG TPA: cellulase family glycosylhydrolase [Longimicrobium sp.]|nr:cellulase family glycosylhydrolase [Longimicrobium sp.]
MLHRTIPSLSGGLARVAPFTSALAFCALLAACDGGGGGGGGGGGPVGPATASLAPLGATQFNGAPGFALDDSVAVRVTGSGGAPLAGAAVSFEVTGGAGSVSPASVTTNADGVAKTRWTMGAEGANTLRAALPSFSATPPVAFSATAAWGPEAALSVVSGNQQVTAAGCAPLAPVLLKVADASGAPVANAPVYLNVTAGGGRVTSTKLASNAQGLVQVPWTLDAAGAHALQASLHSRTPAQVDLAATAVPVAPGGVAAAGNILVDTRTCKPHRFIGLARSGLESWPTGDDRLFSPTLARQDFLNIRSWGSNVVRIPLNPAYWVKTAGSYSAGYPEQVDSAIARARSQGLDVVIDMHFSDRGDPSSKAYRLERMADANHGITFWKEVAARYRNDGRVIFELYNEPHDISWDTWLNGGPSGDGYMTAGYQQLYDAVRSTGAQNLVIVNGLNWGYDMSQAGTHMLNGYNIIYGMHVYDWPEKQPARWEQDFGYLAARVPMMIGEFGTTDCGTAYYKSVMDYADQKNMSWIGWAWYAPPADRQDLLCSFAALITDWNGTPSPMGAVVKAHMQGYPR